MEGFRVVPKFRGELLRQCFYANFLPIFFRCGAWRAVLRLQWLSVASYQQLSCLRVNSDAITMLVVLASFRIRPRLAASVNV
jgi:hypothetical protein